jgi:hypothetical protein
VGNVEQSGERIPQKKGKKGKTAHEIMSRQISDQKAVITDEEFKNLNIEVDADNSHKPLEIPDNPERPKDEEKDHPFMTPWDVIKE